jgi:hypothetical protein
MIGELLVFVGIIVFLLTIGYQRFAAMPCGYTTIIVTVIASVLIIIGVGAAGIANHEEGLSEGHGIPLENLPIGNEYRVFSVQVVNNEEHMLLIGTDGKIVYYKTGGYVNVSPGDWLTTVQSEKGTQLRTYSNV